MYTCIMSLRGGLRALQKLASRVAAGALLATPVVVTFADTVGSVGTVTGCSMRVCVTNHKYWKKDSMYSRFQNEPCSHTPHCFVQTVCSKSWEGPNEIFLPHYMLEV